jgi:ABC-type Fe3+/spermidine/putrescine transport system ATPase subunit
VAGLERAEAGEIWLRGQPVKETPPQERMLGVVFQDQALFRQMSVENNIEFGLKLRKAERTHSAATVSQLLEMIGLEKHRAKYPAQLSGGERQRVAIARALAYGPRGVLLDEPFGALDPLTRAQLRRDVRQILKRLNVPALLITHDQEEALEIGDRIAILNNGQIEQIGTPYEIYNHPRNEFVATFLGAANVLLGQWREGKVAIGGLRLKPPPDAPMLFERQPVKIVFRPEDAMINFQRQLLDVPYFLASGVVEEVNYAGPVERLIINLSLWPAPSPTGKDSESGPRLRLLSPEYGETFPIRISRTKWESADMELSPGDPVVVGLKNYHLLPHYPLQSESSGKAAW